MRYIKTIIYEDFRSGSIYFLVCEKFHPARQGFRDNYTRKRLKLSKVRFPTNTSSIRL